MDTKSALENLHTASPGGMEALKASLGAWLKAEQFDAAQIDGFLPKLDVLAQDAQFAKTPLSHIEHFIRHTIEKQANHHAEGANVVGLHAGRFRSLEGFTSESIAQELGRIVERDLKPVDENAVKLLRDRAAGKNTAPAAPKAEKGWSTFTQEEKVHVGISALFSGIFLMDGFSRMAKGLSAKDELGNAKTNYSDLGIGVVTTLIGGGLAYLTHSQYSKAGVGIGR